MQIMGKTVVPIIQDTTAPKRCFVIFLAAAQLLSFLLDVLAWGQQPPQVSLHEEPELLMPGAHEGGADWGVDGNSPAERDAEGRLLLYTLCAYPWHAAVPNTYKMSQAERVTILTRESIEGVLWVEATYRDQDGAMFGWFHNEVSARCPNSYLGIPRIRQMISF